MNTQFNGDISKWDVSNVTDISEMFKFSNFDDDISQWNTSNVKDMSDMFYASKFNGDISKWNVSSVKTMARIFEESLFNGDITDWEPYKLENASNAFRACSAPVPYWMEYEGMDERNRTISAYQLNKKLSLELNENSSPKKRMKI